MRFTERHWFSPFWKLTYWGFQFRNMMFGNALVPHRGCDEWHNLSWYITVPLLGVFTWFPRKDWFGRDGEEHLHGRGPDGYYGRIVLGCDICQEMKDDMDAER